MAKMILLHGGESTPYVLEGKTTVLGRHPECDIQLNSNMVSRRHAQLTEDDGQYSIEDMGSGNGTFVNGTKVESPTLLKHDDRVKLGPLLFRFEVDVAATSPTVSMPKSGPATDSLAKTITANAFNFSETAESEDMATITGSVDNSSGFGTLDVRPEAKLKAVIEISRALAGTVDVERLLPKILEILFQIFPAADRGCILLRAEDSEKMIPRAILHRRGDDDESVKLSRTILRKVLEQKTGILSADAASDSRFDASESISSLTIRSMMCVPLLSLDGEPLGIINIDTQNPLTQFREDDLDLLLAVAGQAALCYENARLMVSFAEKTKQDNEMNIARNVQHALLPDEFPDADGYEFAASYEAAQAVGGDYYDIFTTPDNKICLAFGDVAGKGVPASLVMSRMSSVVRSTLEHTTNAEDAVTRINNHMCAKSVEGRFVTFVLTLLDLESNEMEVVNAGHMSPIIRKPDGSIEEFDEDTIGVPIGVVPDFPFDVVKRTLNPRESVVIYTDGVSEAMNPASELYGLDRIRELVAKTDKSAAELGRIIREDVKKHANGREQNDDITLMVFGRLG